MKFIKRLNKLACCSEFRIEQLISCVKMRNFITSQQQQTVSELTNSQLLLLTLDVVTVEVEKKAQRTSIESEIYGTKAIRSVNICTIHCTDFAISCVSLRSIQNRSIMQTELTLLKFRLTRQSATALKRCFMRCKTIDFLPQLCGF